LCQISKATEMPDKKLRKMAEAPRPLVTTKFRPPNNRGRLIERPQLIESLRATMDRKLALVHGPAGFGKTTLVAQWFDELKTNGVGAAWLAIDAADNNRNRFLTYLVEALRMVEPEIGPGLWDLIESSPATESDFVLDTLVSDISIQDAEFVLFIDDWHLILDTAVITALHRLISHQPPNLHIVITSRARTGLPLANLRVRNELVEIDASKLRFDLSESRQYLDIAGPSKLDEDGINALWQSTEGWAAALQLASLSLRGSGRQVDLRHWTSGTANDIGEYLAENVLDNLPAEQTAFLVRTSILDRMCGDLCVAVTGERSSRARLDELESQELFLLPLDEERQWFRYHHLFARYLQQRLKKQYPDEVSRLHRSASDWFSEHGHTEEAVQHAIASGDAARAVELVERGAMLMVERGHMSTLLGLLRDLPRTALLEDARLQLAIAWAYTLTHRPDESEVALWHVKRIAQQSNPEIRKRLLGESDVLTACTAVYGDEIDCVPDLAQPCLDEPEVYSNWTVGVAANVLAYHHLHSGALEKVGPILLRARDYQDSAQGLFSGVYGRCFQGIALHRAGRFEQARSCFDDAINIARISSGPQSCAIRLASGLMGQLCYEANQLNEAERLLEACRSLGQEGGVADIYLATYLASCRLWVQRGEHQTALDLLQEGEDIARALSLYRFGVAIACERARVRLELGDLRGAEQSLADADARRYQTGTIPAHDSEEVTIFLDFARVRLLCARKAFPRAEGIMAARASAAADAGWNHLAYLAQIQLALIFDQQGNEPQAERTLLDVVNAAVPKKMVRPFLDEGSRLISILERIRDRQRHQPRTPSADQDAIAFSASADQLITASKHPVDGLPLTGGWRLRATDFTSRETEVLRLLNQGMANKEIARTLDVSADTVKWHLKNVFIKLGVGTRTQAINETRRLQLFNR
tara:strand:+ start:521 stop:3313 length:2793 start_codon:yes stop_codon:yes gene_type:complete